jgi:hypothetical protein
LEIEKMEVALVEDEDDEMWVMRMETVSMLRN